jgi:hypothetical protein
VVGLNRIESTTGNDQTEIDQKGNPDFRLSQYPDSGPLVSETAPMMNSSLARRTRIGRGRPNLFGRRHSARPRLELLEERTLLSTWTVTNNSDSPTDTGSLRYAIANAPSGATINFAATVTSPIVLTNGALTIKTNLDIEGPGPLRLTIDGNNKSSVFQTSSGVTATIAGLTIADGKAVSAGGINNEQATLTVKNCNIANNSAFFQGGGIFNKGTLTLIDSTVSNNSALQGGGLFNPPTFTMTVANCTLSTNAAGLGGGIYSNGALTVTNSTLWGNSATVRIPNTGSGGGIETNGSGIARVINCTVAGNSAEVNGGGIDTRFARIVLANTIIAGNSLTNPSAMGPDVRCTIASLIPGQGYNVIGNTSGSFGWSPNNKLNVNPLLTPLGNYGGPTQTIAILPGSPAIGTGSTALIPPGVVTDQRGKPRLTNGKVDIGAFQSQGFTITAASGDHQSTSINSPFAAPLVVDVKSAYGEPVQGGVVTFTAPQHGASCTFPGGSNTAVIDASGLASINVAANSTAGQSYTVLGTASGGFSSAFFTLSNLPGEPYQLAIHIQPSPTATAGAPFAVQPVIYVEDQHGNLVTSDSTTQVTASLAAGTGPLLGTTTVTVSGGVATFGAGSDHPLQDNTAEIIRIAFSSGNLLGATSDPIVIAHASPDHLVLHTLPSTATAGRAFSPGPVIYIEDQHGNLVTSDNSTQVAVSLASGAGPLQGTTIVTVSGGVASFANLYDNTAETITLSFASDSTLGQVVSGDIVVNPAAPSALVMHSQPSATATAGQIFATQPVVYEVDQFGNLVTTDNTTQVTASLAAGTGPLLGTTTVTVSGGVATFGAGSDLPLQDNTAEVIKIAFSSGKLVGVTSDPIVVGHASADHLVIQTQPSTAMAGQAFNPGPVIYVEDPHGNLVTSDNSTQVAVSLASGTGPLQGTTIVTVSGGVASFANLYDNTAETITLSFASDSTLDQVVSDDIVVSPAAPSALVMHTQPSQTATAGQAFTTQPVVYELDQFGNLVTTDNTTQVTASLRTGAGPLLGTTTVTVSGGIATFTNLTDDKAEIITLMFTGTRLKSLLSNPIKVSPAPASQFRISAPATVSPNTAFTITVTAYDPYWNVATGYRGTVRLKSSDNLAALPGNYTFTAGDGGAHTFGNAVKLKTSGMQTITVRDTTNPAITGSASVQVSSGSSGAVLSHAAVGGDGGRPLLKLQGTWSQTRALTVWSRPWVAASRARARTVAQGVDLLDHARKNPI